MNYPFKVPNFDQWIDQINKDLKGKDLDSLSRKVDTDLSIKAIYNSNIESLKVAVNDSNQWKIAQTFNDNHSNKNVLDSLNRGVNDLYVPSKNMDDLLKGVNRDIVDINLIDSAKKQNDFNSCNDPISHSLKTGNLANFSNKQVPLTVDSRLIQLSGGSIKNQVAYIYGSLIEQLKHIDESEISVTLSSVRIFTSASTNYLSEISKLRAIKALWPAFCKIYGQSDITTPFIYAETSGLEYSNNDSKTNMLRATTQAMAAILGGASSIEIHPFDYKEKTNDDFGLRIAQNLHHVLKEEAHLDKVKDPAKGAYAIEHLTSEIANHAWDAIQKLEDSGGLLNSINSGAFQKIIEHDANFIISEFKSQNKVLVGANKYMNNQIGSGPSVNTELKETVVKVLIPINLDNHIKIEGKKK